MTLTPASLKIRLAALIYESLLLLGVTAAGLVFSAVAAYFLHNFPRLQTFTVGIILILVWRGYFLSAWQKKEQTLAMKTWKIRLRGKSGKKATPRQLRARFLWASVWIILLPALVYLFTRRQGYAAQTAMWLALLWWILPFGFALFHPQKQFLHDAIAGTALWREK